MKLNSKSNLLFRMILNFSYLLIIWYPTLPYIFIVPIFLNVIDRSNDDKKIKMLAILMCVCAGFYFFLNDLDVEQQIAISFVILLMGFSDIFKKQFKNYPLKSKK